YSTFRHAPSKRKGLRDSRQSPQFPNSSVKPKRAAPHKPQILWRNGASSHREGLLSESEELADARPIQVDSTMGEISTNGYTGNPVRYWFKLSEALDILKQPHHAH